MGQILVRGQKSDVTKNSMGLRNVHVGLSWEAQGNVEIDSSAFLVGQNGKITKEEDFVFYGQQVSSCQSVRLRQNGMANEKQGFSIDLLQVPTQVHKIVFSVTIHHSEERNHFFQDVRNIKLSIKNDHTNVEMLSFPITYSFSKESAIIVGELYRYSGEWKFNSIGAGYFGGLSALCKDFGIKVDDEPNPNPLKVQNAGAISANQKPEQPKSKPAINIKKVELKKKQSVNIQKPKMITATLEWDTYNDLDLYCFYVTKDGQVGKIYYKDLGSSNVSPYIVLDGDSQEAGKETVRIYRTDALKYVLFAAYSAVGNGVGSFYSMKARAVVNNHMGNVVTATLTERNDYAYWVCIAHIDFTNHSEMKISQVESYSREHSEASPLLYADGSFRMDVGPIEFKNEEDYDNYFG